MVREDQALLTAYAEQLQEALDLAGGTHSLDDVRSMIESGEAQLWERGDAVLITQIDDYPQKRVLTIWLAAGKLEDVLAAVPVLEEMLSAELGVEQVTVVGRRGWAKFADGMGYKPTMTHYTKEL